MPDDFVSTGTTASIASSSAGWMRTSLRRGRDPRDSPRMYLKTAIILAAFVLAYVALVFFATTWWQALPLAVALGVATAGIGFNIMHDGGHLAYSRDRRVNRAMAMTLDLVGGSSYIWQWKHARFHHTWVNVDGHDSDIDLGVLARLSPQQRLASVASLAACVPVAAVRRDRAALAPVRRLPRHASRAPSARARSRAPAARTWPFSSAASWCSSRSPSACRCSSIRGSWSCPATRWWLP